MRMNENDSQPASEHDRPKPEVTKFEDLCDDAFSCVCNRLLFRDVNALQYTSKTFRDSSAMKPHNEAKPLMKKMKNEIEDGASSASEPEASFSDRAQKLLKCCLGQRGQEEKGEEINGLDGPMTQKEWQILRSKLHEVFNSVKDGLNFKDATKLVLLENKEIEKLRRLAYKRQLEKKYYFKDDIPMWLDLFDKFPENYYGNLEIELDEVAAKTSGEWFTGAAELSQLRQKRNLALKKKSWIVLITRINGYGPSWFMISLKK